MLKEIFACFAVFTHRYMHFLPAMKATRSFLLGGASFHLPFCSHHHHGEGNKPLSACRGSLTSAMKSTVEMSR